MTAWPEQLVSALDKGTVRVEIFFLFHLTPPVRIWTGFGPIIALGETWRGTDVISSKLPELEQMLNGTASRVTFEVSGVDQYTQALAVQEASEIDGRRLDLLLGLFNTNGQLIGNPQYLDVYRMDEVQVSRQTDDETGVETRSISLDVASPLAARSTARQSFYTAADQRSRYPDDAGCDRVGSYQNRPGAWPTY